MLNVAKTPWIGKSLLLTAEPVTCPRPPGPMGNMMDPDVTVQTVGCTALKLGAKDSVPFVANRKQASSPYLGSEFLHSILAVVSLTYLILPKWLRVRGC